jgi:hypothetical protein
VVTLRNAAIHAMSFSFVSEDDLNRSVREHMTEAHYSLREQRVKLR